MDGLYLLALCALTTGALAWVLSRLGFGRGRWGPAAARALECVGLAMLMLVLNVALGMALVLAIRAASGQFVSLYANTDLTLLGLSSVQALVVQSAWQDRRGD